MKKIFLLISCLTLFSCKAKDKTDNSGLQADVAAKQAVVSTGSTTGGIGSTTGGIGSNTEGIGSTTEVSDSGDKTSSLATRDPAKIDLDLTKMSATMIYSTIFDMLVMAEDYIDKNIKVSGWFETYTDPETGKMYYAVVVPDATACCQQGLEFVWPGEHKYPEDFPAIKQEITVTGIYKLIENDGISYNYLEASSVEF